MTKYSTTIDVTAFTTDAKFRTWGSTCSAGLASAGFVQTADTGQINWVTVTKPVATNTKAGYEIWRYDDSLQGGHPVYFRIDYGSGGVASGNSPSTWITLGTGSNGTGTITGPVIGPLQSGYNGATAPNNPAMTVQFTHSLANGYGLLNFGRDQTIGSAGFGPGLYLLERTKDSSGASTTNGIGLSLYIAASGVTLKDLSINFDTTTAFSTQRSMFCGALSTVISLTHGLSVVLYRHYICPGQPYFCTGRVGYFVGDIADNTTVTAAPVGASTHTYYANSALAGADSAGSGAILVAYMWED